MDQWSCKRRRHIRSTGHSISLHLSMRPLRRHEKMWPGSVKIPLSDFSVAGGWLGEARRRQSESACGPPPTIAAHLSDLPEGREPRHLLISNCFYEESRADAYICLAGASWQTRFLVCDFFHGYVRRTALAIPFIRFSTNGILFWRVRDGIRGSVLYGPVRKMLYAAAGTQSKRYGLNQSCFCCWYVDRNPTKFGRGAPLCRRK
jgi:hypothetical protein